MITAAKNRLRFAYGFLLHKHEGLHFHFFLRSVRCLPEKVSNLISMAVHRYLLSHAGHKSKPNSSLSSYRRKTVSRFFIR